MKTPRPSASYRADRRNKAAKPWPGIDARYVGHRIFLRRCVSARGEAHYQGAGRNIRAA